MTKEEIEELIGLAASVGLYDDKNPGKRAVILGKAIKELQQEPCKNAMPNCEDAINREAVINHICESKDCYKNDCKGRLYKRCHDLQWVYELPSVNPQKPICPSEGVDPAYEKTLNKWIGAEVLDRIRAEIDEEYDRVHPYDISCAEGLEMALNIIDKYKSGSEEV